MLKATGFGNRAWTERFIANSLEFAVMARRIGEEALAKSFEDQAERARLRRSGRTRATDLRPRGCGATGLVTMKVRTREACFSIGGFRQSSRFLIHDDLEAGIDHLRKRVKHGKYSITLEVVKDDETTARETARLRGM